MASDDGTTAVGWGILGVGNVCEVKSGPALQKAEGSNLVAVMRRTKDKAVDFAARHSIMGKRPIAAYDSAAELVADPNVTAVYIASPPGSHSELAMKVLAAGKPCYVEKPLARNATESKSIVAAFAAANVPLFVAYYRRGQPRFQKAKAIVASGVLGHVTSVVYRKTSSHHSNPESSFASSVPWRIDRAQAGGGLLLDVGCHALDILEYMLGAPLENVRGDASARGAYPAVAASEKVEDQVQVHAAVTAFTGAGLGAGASASSAVVDCSWNFATDETQDLFTISGTTGKLQLSCFGTEALKLSVQDDAGNVTVQEFTFPKLEHVQQPLIQLIVDELTSTGDAASSPSKGDNAIRVAEVMDVALSRYYGGREDDFWKRPIPQ